jgi:hypothetical protein
MYSSYASVNNKKGGAADTGEPLQYAAAKTGFNKVWYFGWAKGAMPCVNILCISVVLFVKTKI